MTQPLSLVFPFIAGAFLGSCYFTGLWWTLRRLPTARRPYGILYGSYLLRLGLFLGGMALFLDGGLPSLAALMTGFLLARLILVGRLARYR